ncbi:hypothetical protein V500_03507, partial [Pseudogymnoascus sp. VKM F-4518 (FW-2643)]
RYIICLKTSLQAVESPQPSKVAVDFKDGDSDLVSEVMTDYTDTGSETELTTYSSVVNAAVKAGGEFDGTTLRNDEAHKTAHPIDTNTSLDQSPADVEFSHTTEDANASRQAHAVEENSKLTDERGQIRPDITQVSRHPENANIKGHIRGLSQPLETVQSSEHPKPFNTTEVIQKAQEDLLWTPLIQPSEQGNTDNEISNEETLYLPSIAVRMSSDANIAEWCNQQQNVAPAASIAKEPKQLYPLGSFILTQDPHSATNAFIATALPSFFEETGPLQPSSELPSNSQRPGTAISISTNKPPPFPPFLEPRCYLSPPKIVLPPAANSSLTHARRPSAYPISTSLSSHALRQDTMSGNPKTSLELAALKTVIGSQPRNGPS